MLVFVFEFVDVDDLIIFDELLFDDFELEVFLLLLNFSDLMLLLFDEFFVVDFEDLFFLGVLIELLEWFCVFQLELVDVVVVWLGCVLVLFFVVVLFLMLVIGVGCSYLLFFYVWDVEVWELFESFQLCFVYNCIDQGVCMYYLFYGMYFDEF